MSAVGSPMTNINEIQAMNTKKTITPAGQNSLVSEHSLTLQDEYYAKRRLPAATPAGAEDRTYCFRVEFEHDLYPLSHMLRWATETWWSSPLCPWGDADVKMTLKPDTLALDEIRWLLACVTDFHVAVETVELERNYTGNRKYRTEQELAVKVPTIAALKASLAGLADYRDALAIADERALEAEAELEVELNAMDFSDHLATLRGAPSEPVSLTLAWSKHAST